MKKPTLRDWYNVGGYSIAACEPGSALRLVATPMGEAFCTEREILVLLGLPETTDLDEWLSNPVEEKKDHSMDWLVTRQGLGLEVEEDTSLVEKPYLHTKVPTAMMDARESWRARAVENNFYDGGFAADCTMPFDSRPDIEGLRKEGKARAKRAWKRMGLVPDEDKVTVS